MSDKTHASSSIGSCTVSDRRKVSFFRANLFQRSAGQTAYFNYARCQKITPNGQKETEQSLQLMNARIAFAWAILHMLKLSRQMRILISVSNWPENCETGRWNLWYSGKAVILKCTAKGIERSHRLMTGVLMHMNFETFPSAWYRCAEGRGGRKIALLFIVGNRRLVGGKRNCCCDSILHRYSRHQKFISLWTNQCCIRDCP